MTLQIDPRRITMLQEMGLRLLPPLSVATTVAEPASCDVAPAPVVARAAPLADVPRMAADRSPAGLASLDWAGLQQAVAACRACGLCEGRSTTVFGVGPAHADWMVVGDAPGEAEELQGEPFVGEAGQLLDNMLRPLGLDRRRNVYLTNVLKCRPPGNRNPEPQELAECEPFLRRQVELLQPKIILAMGRFAVHTLLQSTEPIGRLRGRAHAYQGVPVVVTFHPAYLLRNLPDKAKAWADLCLAMDLVEARG